jgi:hypothetical protein
VKVSIKGNIIRNKIWILLIPLLIASIQSNSIFASLSAQSIIRSTGSIIESAPIGVSFESVPLGIIGDDYLLYTSGDPDKVWLTNDVYSFPKLEKLAMWNCSVARLGFVFPNSPVGPSGVHSHSFYDASKMDRVLDIFGSVGVKGILCDFNNNDLYNYYGSWEWVNNWKEVAEQFKGDNRVEAFQIANEPYPTTWATQGPFGEINTRQKFIQVCGYLIDQIRAIDPKRTIVYPTWFAMGFGYNSMNEWYNELQAYGILQKGNIIYDILHPYYTENEYDMGMDPVEKVVWFRDNYIVPAVGLFGSKNIWIGETFAWVEQTPLPGDQHLATHDIQVQFLSEMINVCLDCNISFQVWSYFGKQMWQDDALTASRYLD